MNGIQFMATMVPLSDANAIKTIVTELEREQGNAVIALGSISGDKPSLTIKISDALVKSKGLNAGTMVRELAQQFLKGGGGGQPGFANAGGSEVSGLPAALDAVKRYL